MNYQAMLDTLGIEYTVRGDEAVALCPAHAERHPSWSCNLETGLHNCFTCGFHGSFYVIIGRYLGLRSKDAREWARSFQRDKSQITAMLEKQPPMRRVYSEEDLSFYYPPPSALAPRGISPAAARDLDILWDKEKGEWILPIRSPYTGDLWGWQTKKGRTVRNVPHGVTKSQALFGFPAIPDRGELIVVESPLDVGYLYTLGYHNAVSTYGVGISNDQINTLLDHCPAIVFALDNDSAGRVKSLDLASNPRLVGRSKFFNYEGMTAKDPGELTPSEIAEGLDSAIRSVKYLVDG